MRACLLYVLFAMDKRQAVVKSADEEAPQHCHDEKIRFLGGLGQDHILDSPPWRCTSLCNGS